MTTNGPSLWKFLLRAFLWLPVCFAAWYFSAQLYAVVIGFPTAWLLNQLQPGILSGMAQRGLDLVFVTSIKVRLTPESYALKTLQVNFLIYTYGLALFLALMLAAHAKWWKILIGAIVLLPFQIWGLAFNFLSHLVTMLGPNELAKLGFLGWHIDAISLGKRVGDLFFPSLIPLLLWVGFNLAFIGRLSGSRTHSSPTLTTIDAHAVAVPDIVASPAPPNKSSDYARPSTPAVYTVTPVQIVSVLPAKPIAGNTAAPPFGWTYPS